MHKIYFYNIKSEYYEKTFNVSSYELSCMLSKYKQWCKYNKAEPEAILWQELVDPTMFDHVKYHCEL